MKDRIVAKTGGSLFDMGDLRHRLRAWLDSTTPSRVLFIAGGGELADGIRNLHHTHGLPEETSHWLAIRTMSVNAYFLGSLLGLPVIDSLENWTESAVLDPLPCFLSDEGQPGALPHNWKVTSDSMAARVAQLAEANLVLLKSAMPPDLPDWESISLAGYVDRYFAKIISDANLTVNCVNFRDFPG
ncbi:amino acid kinase family protein [Zavarzinella formosa]|uniref:hypothetical protein n=1 Tax=Zavarzinella formosa TaxID=360055 RepID=UPI0002E78F4E|nr:hypothetical protein [Zavarzinella formosa]